MWASIDTLALPPFRPRFPWLGGDLQTVASVLRPPPKTIAYSTTRLCFPLTDGTGDVLLAMLDRPRGPIAKASAGIRTHKPLAIVIHGLTGSEQSSYVVSLARLLLEHGHCVLRLNLRGAGASRATCAGEYYAGRSEDLRTLMALLPDELVRDGVVGGVFTGRSIAVEVSRRARPGDAASRGGATVSAPIDLAAAGRNLLRPRNFLYHRFVLGHMKRNAKGEGSALSPGYRAALHKVKTVWEYDDVFVAPRHGFADAEDYYERSKPLRFMDAIRIPPLLVAAVNDPWVPFESYRDYDWAANPALVPLLSQDGGHIGFQEAGSSLRWSDLAVAKFFGQAAIVERRPAPRSTLIPSTG